MPHQCIFQTNGHGIIRMYTATFNI